MTIFDEAAAEADAWCAKLDAEDPILIRLDAIAARLDRIDGLLTEFEPVIRAYLDPAASGPVAWAVRKQLGKKAK